MDTSKFSPTSSPGKRFTHWISNFLLYCFWFVTQTVLSNPIVEVFRENGVAAPRINYSAPVHNFITRSVGSTSLPEVFTVRNSGSTPLIIDKVSLSGNQGNQFNLDTTGMAKTLLPGGSTTFQLSFSPTSEGLKRGSIEISSNDMYGAYYLNCAGLARNNKGGRVVAWGRNIDGECNVPPELTDVVAVSAGYYHSLALKSDGTVVGWGGGIFSGQSASTLGFVNVVDVAVGGSHHLVLKSDGTVSAWGANWYNQRQVPAGLKDVVAIAAGGAHSLALKNDGTVVAWGLNLHGQATVPTYVTGVVGLGAGDQHSLGIHMYGFAYFWGNNRRNQNAPPQILPA